MPPRVATVGAAPTLGDQYRSIPPLTRTLATAAVAAALGEKLGLVRGGSLILYWPYVVGRLQVWLLCWIVMGSVGEGEGSVWMWWGDARFFIFSRFPIFQPCTAPIHPTSNNTHSSGACSPPSSTWARST